MIREYIIVDCIYSDGFNPETIAMIRDAENDIVFSVVINDYSIKHIEEHKNDVFSHLNIGDHIKGELHIIYTRQIEIPNGKLWEQSIKINDKIISPHFEGKFEVLDIEPNGSILLQHPYWNSIIKTEPRVNIIVENKTVNLCGELYLETIGDAWKECINH